MKAVLLAIQPKYCELIASGEKTIEVRKTRPKLEVPFKCFIYCTKELVIKRHIVFGNEYRQPSKNLLVKIPDKYSKENEICFIETPIINEDYKKNILNGKVIGEFICDRIENLKYVPTKFYGKPVGTYEETICIASCLTVEEIESYAKGGNIYGWHISDLKIYDKPKELSEFCSHSVGTCFDCPHYEISISEFPCNECLHNDSVHKYLSRPPQSWQYIEV